MTQSDSTIARIPLHARDGSVRAYAIVDAADAAWANQWTWRLHTNPARSHWASYAVRHERPGGDKGRLIRYALHRVLLGLEPDDPREPDHIDRDGLNNRRSNLRIVPHGQNVQNTVSRHGAASQFRGVTWHKQKRKWVAQIRISPRTICLGGFDNEADAAGLALTARLELLPGATD